MLKNLIYNIGSKGMVFISQFIVLVLTNHIIGPEGRGIFIAAVTWSATFFSLSNFSLSTGILNLSNKSADNIYKLAYASAIAALVLGLASLLLGFVFYAIMPSLFNNLSLKYIALAFVTIPFMMMQQYTMAIVQVKGNFKAFNILYASYGIINLTGIIVIWLAHKTSVDQLLYINLAAWFFTGAISFWFLYPNFIKRHTGNSIFKLFAKTSLAAHIGSIVTFVVSRADILIINYFCNEKQTGIYGLTVGMVQILLIIPLSIQNLLYHSLLAKPKDEQKQILLQNSRLTFAIMLLAATVVFLIRRPLVNLIGGKGFEDAVPLFKYFLPAIIFYSMPMILSTQWNIMGIFRQINTTAIIVLVLSLVGNILLVPIIGITGGAITFLAIAFISFCIHIWFVQKQLGNTGLRDIIIIKPDDIKVLFGTK
jgi:O-antigen/teichoic acid export membrane protein